MTVDEYNRFCRSLTNTTHVVQWGGAHVWKIGGKVFAIGGWNDSDQELFVTFKCSPMSYDMLKEMPGCRPAPYLASRGMKWIQRTSAKELDDRGLKDYLRASYQHVANGLPKRIRQELGLANQPSGIRTRARSESKAVAKPAVAAKSPAKAKKQTTTTATRKRTRSPARKGAVR